MTFRTALSIALLCIAYGYPVTGHVGDALVQQATRVDIVRGGDTALDGALALAVAKAFNAAPDFSISYGSMEGSILVAFSRNVRLSKEADELKVAYHVNFLTTGGAVLGQAEGFCSPNDLNTCAKAIVVRCRAATGQISKSRHASR